MNTNILNKSIKTAKGKFTQIPNYILINNSISDGAFRTYAVLKSYKICDNKVFPAEETVAKERSKTIRTIGAHLKELRAKGLIRAKRRGYSSTNQYDFITEENFLNEDNIQEENFRSVEKKTSVLSRKNLPPNNTKIKKTVLNNSEKNKKTGIEILRPSMYKLGLKK